MFLLQCPFGIVFLFIECSNSDNYNILNNKYITQGKYSYRDLIFAFFNNSCAVTLSQLKMIVQSY